MIKTIRINTSDLNALRSKKLEDLKRSSNFNSHFGELESFLSELEDKKIDYLKEFIANLQDTDISIITDSIRRVTGNIDQSINSFKSILDHIRFFLEDTFSPEIDFDEDGELVFEWYGRLGARANLTFSCNGEMYFISLFHGQREKLKLYANPQSVERINDTLAKLFYDKTL
jgi:hypothetical protein